MSANEPTNTRNDDDEMRAPGKPSAVAVPERQPSGLGSRPAARTKSWLERHGPSLPSADVPPERSPIGAVRQSSGLTQKVIDTTRVKTEIAKKEEQGTEGVAWHSMNTEELCSELELKDIPEGLTTEDATRRLEKYGPNKISEAPTKSILMRFLESLLGGFQLMMMSGGVLSFVVYGIDTTDFQSLTLAIMLFLVTLITSAFQAYQEGKADSVMEALRAQMADKVNVLRDGVMVHLDAVNLVPGDVVEVQGGEKVPADVRILVASDLKVNNASLTGENVDIKLGPDANHTRIFEAKNIARSGCNFTSGKGHGLVFATGDNTFFGQIAFATTQTERPDTLMKREVNRLIMIMAVIAFVVGATFLGLSLGRGVVWNAAVVYTIGIIVANVPEGLLPQLTVALALTAKKLFEKDVLVTNLEIIESLGACTVICSDKTGTLTCNRMTVSHVVYNSIVHTTPNAPDREGDAFPDVKADNAGFLLLRRCTSLCSDAVFTTREDPDVLKWDVKGDASEAAMVKFVQPYGDILDFRKANKRGCTIPFNSTNKYMVSINRVGETHDNVLLMKGAPERIFDRCVSIVNSEGKVVPFDPAQRAIVEGHNSLLGKRGERVIAFAERLLPAAEYGEDFVFDAEGEFPNFPMNGLTLIGLISMIDPPRKTVPAAIKACFAGGIKVFMVTGDHPITALAIAKSLGLVTMKTEEELKEDNEPVPEGYAGSIAIHGSDLGKFTQADWDRVLKYKEIVFARTMPQQKQDIVRQLSNLGHIVAMTGDGVNDAPALKAAHIGVAMGSGAQVAKEAAQVVVLKDDFSSIVEGVREGRTIFENMKKAISYVLASNIPELVPFLIYIGGDLPLAMEILVVLCIDLGTDILPAIALAYEDAEDVIMLRPPRTPDDHLVGARLIVVSYLTIGIFQTLAMLLAFFWVFHDAGYPTTELFNSGGEYRASAISMSAHRKEFFTGFCKANVFFRGNASNFEVCREFRLGILERAQGAAFFQVVWGQLANLLCRKTFQQSIFDWNRMTHNRVLIFSFVLQIVLVCMLVLIPGLNAVFGMGAPQAKHVFVGLWVFPLTIVWEEGRKWFVRNYPDGYVAWCTLF